MAKRQHDKILKHKNDTQHPQKTGAFITQAISQRDGVQAGTNVSLPSEENVKEARRWVAHNKK